ncbi:translation initiation factor eIF 4e-like domain-containing protein [Panaeolus papilionaceus]|nr:translation initiation factor eIF 4e-like domain-containing protein [Panaeolus papilionaceus]
MDGKAEIDILIIDGSDGDVINEPVLDGADRSAAPISPTIITRAVDQSQPYRPPRPSIPKESIIFHGTQENNTAENIHKFLQRYPPSSTPLLPDHFICVTKFKDPQLRLGLEASNLTAMMESFKSLIESNNVTPESVDAISREHSVLTGKWVIFVPVSKVDELWAKVVNLVCVDGRAQCANVRTTPRRGFKQNVICVWVENYTDERSVVELRRELLRIGVRKEILFKTDAYSYLDIYKDNPWGMRPGIVYDWK